MEFNQAYKSSAWEFFASSYKENIQSLNAKYLQILRKHGKILLRADGSVMLDINNMAPFFLFSGEFFKLLQVATRYHASVSPNLFDSNGQKKLNASIDELSAALDVSQVGLNALVFNNREKDYEIVNTQGTSSVAEKSAALFADCVIACDLTGDFAPYSALATICNNCAEPSFTKDLYDFGITVFQTIELQNKPYITGTIMESRKAKGVCPDCGGQFKGLFSKKCSRCGAPKK